MSGYITVSRLPMPYLNQMHWTGAHGAHALPFRAPPNRRGGYYDHPAWISASRKGKLGGPGYTHKSASERHRLLNACVRRYGYRSCLGSVQVLERNRAIKASHGPVLASDRLYLERAYGNRG